MLSKEAKQVIQMLRNGKEASEKAKQVAINEKDSLFMQLNGIFEERKTVDEQAMKLVLKDKLTLTLDNADGVHGEWLKYLDMDPE
ncbi:MAG: hypothetical protein K6T85_17860, partial [Gorillibacterium sp.]|nr:hypothetical protein [Gorillibacterium sp.]